MLLAATLPSAYQTNQTSYAFFRAPLSAAPVKVPPLRLSAAPHVFDGEIDEILLTFDIEMHLVQSIKPFDSV